MSDEIGLYTKTEIKKGDVVIIEEYNKNFGLTFKIHCEVKKIEKEPYEVDKIYLKVLKREAK